MEREINIAELLKDCPKGTKLYTPIAGDVELFKVTEDPKVLVRVPGDNLTLEFTPIGHYTFYFDNKGEVLLFPSKDNRSWENFEKDKKDKTESKDTLENGFKIGDVVCTQGNYVGYIVEISIMSVTVNNLLDYVGKFNDDQLRFATDEEIDKWNNSLHLNGYHYSKSKKKIVDWFRPFDRVLVRNGRYGKWRCSLFSYYEKEREKQPYFCGNSSWEYCIRYNEKTAHLIGTRDDYEEDGE